MKDGTIKTIYQKLEHFMLGMDEGKVFPDYVMPEPPAVNVGKKRLWDQRKKK